MSLFESDGMKRKKLGMTDDDPNVVGYALFNKEKRAFVVLTEGDYEPTDVYTGDLEDAFLADNMGDAFSVMMELEGYASISIVPVIWNELFGLSVKPGPTGGATAHRFCGLDHEDV